MILDYSVCDSVRNSVWNSVRWAVHNSVCNSVRVSVWDSTPESFYASIEKFIESYDA
jgi:hypothetical protein